MNSYPIVALGSGIGGALETEARQTRVCAFLSRVPLPRSSPAILLGGLGLNAWLG